MAPESVLLAQWDWSAPELPIDSWIFGAVFLVVLVFFIWVVARLTSSATEDIDPAEVDRQMLTAVTELKTRGELTSEEFRSIKSQLVGRLTPENAPEDSDDSSTEEGHSIESGGDSSQTTETQQGTQVSEEEKGSNSPAHNRDQLSEEDPDAEEL